MDKHHFEKLITGVREAGKINRGEKQPSKIFAFTPSEIKKIRENIGLTQKAFADVFLVNIRTLQNWEQGRRQPQGPALSLLQILKRDPKHALRALH